MDWKTVAVAAVALLLGAAASHRLRRTRKRSISWHFDYTTERAYSRIDETGRNPETPDEEPSPRQE